MKSSKIFAIFFWVIFITFILQSCSNESLVTAPSNAKSNSKIMEKTQVIPTSSINHTADTVITLPKSKKQLVVPKRTPANKIALLDNYLSTHKISNKPATIIPDAGYYQHAESYWELENQYEPESGHLMGIWVSHNIISDTIAYNKYGFNEICIGPGDINRVEGIGFQSANIMVNLGENPDGLPNYYSVDNNPVGYYFVDETI